MSRARIQPTASLKTVIRMLLVVPILAVSIHAAAAQATTPEPGTPLRKAILDGLRLMVAAEVGAPVEFIVGQMRVADGWAFVSATPQRPGGAHIDYFHTRYRLAVAQGLFDNQAVALLRQSPNGWLVYEYELGATDVPWVEWKDYHPIPSGVLPGF